MNKWILIIFFGGFFSFNYSMVQTIEKRNNDTLLHWMVDDGNFDGLQNCFNKMREKGAPDRYYYPRGQKLQTLLHRAVIKENLQIVQFLFEYPISINAQDEEGSTPLIYSIKQANCEILKYLLKDQCANPAICNKINWSPAHTAVYYRNYKALKLLRAFGADLNVSLCNEIDTPLSIARYLFGRDILFKKIEQKIVAYLENYKEKRPKKRKKMKVFNSTSGDKINVSYEPIFSTSAQFQAKRQRIINKKISASIHIS